MINIDGQSFDPLMVSGLSDWIETVQVYDPMHATYSDQPNTVGTVIHLTDGRLLRVRAPHAQVFAMVDAAKQGLTKPPLASTIFDVITQIAAGFLQAGGWEVVPPPDLDDGEEDEEDEGDPNAPE